MAEARLNPREMARLEEKKKSRKTNAKITAALIAVVLMIALVVFVNSPLFRDGLAALKVGDKSFTVADVNYEYQKNYLQFTQTYGDYISMFFDPQKPLREQECTMRSDGGTWDDYFKDIAESTLVENSAYYDAAVKAGYALTDDERTQIDGIIDNYAVYADIYGTNVDGYIAATFGAGNNAKTLRRHLERELLVERYLNDLYENGFSFTDAEKDAYYAEHAENLDQVKYLYAYIAAAEDKDAAADAKAVVEAMTGTDEAAFREAVKSVTGSEASESSVSKSTFLSQYTDGAASADLKEGAVFTHDSGSGWYVTFVLGLEDNSYHTVNVRHILIKAVDADGNKEYSDEEKKIAYDAVKAIEDEWLAGPATEESFQALAAVRSEDDGSKENGGLYEHVFKGQMVKEFDAFCFEGHKKGDHAIVYGESTGYTGYHLIYFVGEDADPYSRTLADSDLRGDAYNEALGKLTEGLDAERTFMWRYVMKG